MDLFDLKSLAEDEEDSYPGSDDNLVTAIHGSDTIIRGIDDAEENGDNFDPLDQWEDGEESDIGTDDGKDPVEVDANRTSREKAPRARPDQHGHDS